MLEIEKISKSYGKREIINNLSLSFEPGIYALLGPNGAGKSTLINMITQVLQPNSGTITYKGKAVHKNNDYISRVGYLPQAPSFYPNYNACEMLSYLGALKGISRADLRYKIPKLLNEVNLSDIGKKHIKAYSGGMRQRLGIAQSLLNDPEILILDEPFNGLDPKERMRFRNILASLGKNKIIIIATHIVNDIESIADQVILFNKGKIIEKATVENLCQSIEGSVFSGIFPDLEILKDLNISRLQFKEGMYHARIVSDSPSEDYELISNITLEDVYLYHFGADYDPTNLL